MTDLDDLPFHDPDWPPAAAVEVEPRKCRRHQWTAWIDPEIGPAYKCRRCDLARDDTRSRRGKSARRLGGDQERRIEKVYGPVKIGERGDAVDHIGRVWRWQSKATRALPPKWLAAIDKPTHHGVTEAIAAAWSGMTGLYGTRRSVVIRSFVSRGIRARDWLFIGAEDAIAEFGPAIPYYTGWWVIPGDWWLDHWGRDDG